jgi:hypothetical protein
MNASELVLVAVITGALVLLIAVLAATAMSIRREDRGDHLPGRSAYRADGQVRRLTGLRVRHSDDASGPGDDHLRPYARPEADREEQDRMPRTAA